MQSKHTGFAAMMMLSGAALIGCHSESSAPSAMSAGAPTTMPAAPEAMAALPKTTPPAAKDLTHVLTADEPLFASEPDASSKPVGTLKAGSKVLVVIPGAKYSQVITDTGETAYTVTDGLKPLGK